jgi:hypothetical protein
MDSFQDTAGGGKNSAGAPPLLPSAAVIRSSDGLSAPARHRQPSPFIGWSAADSDSDGAPGPTVAVKNTGRSDSASGIKARPAASGGGSRPRPCRAAQPLRWSAPVCRALPHGRLGRPTASRGDQNLNGRRPRRARSARAVRAGS